MNRTERIRYGADQIMRGDVMGWLADRTTEVGDCMQWDFMSGHRTAVPWAHLPRVLPPCKLRSNHLRINVRVMVYEHTRGRKIHTNYRVWNTCETANCVNPDHLTMGSRSQMTKAYKKKAGGMSISTREKIRAIRQSMSPLTWERVQYIRDEMAKVQRAITYKTGPFTCKTYFPSGVGRTERKRQLAAEFGVSLAAIHGVVCGHRWPVEGSHTNPFAGMFAQLIAANDGERKRA